MLKMNMKMATCGKIEDSDDAAGVILRTIQ